MKLRFNKKCNNHTKNIRARSSSNRNDVLQNCPMLKYENDYYILTKTISVAIKRR
jgi:hypothetical protein